jgi:3-hydroxyisobutyrate dehydrogenase-like beta-hydroxyacid dehydrogenase
MGAAVAMRLLSEGHHVSVYNRTRARTVELEQAGAEVATIPAEALAQAESCITMLSDAAAIHDVLLNEAALAALSGRCVIQMGTIGPGQSRDIQQRVQASGADYMEAPVLGSIPEARAGRLLIMVGAAAELFERFAPLLKSLGPDPRLIGPPGTAAAVKLALNQLIAGLTASFSVSLAFIRRQGLDAEQFMELLRSSALYAPTFDKKLPRMLARDFGKPNFPTRHLLKDIKLFIAEAKGLGVKTELLEVIGRLLEETKSRGGAEMDYSALYGAVWPRRAPSSND